MNTDQVLEMPPATDACSLAHRLVCALGNCEIQYCLWKGSQFVADGMAGVDDLDLLVAKADFAAMVATLAEHGFKRCESTSGLDLPGVFHYYGYDSDTQRFVHVHLYTRLLTGESLVQTHWLPFESMLLEKGEMRDGVRVTSRSAELAVFVLRMMIKSGSLLEILWFGDRSRAVKDKLDWLLSGTDVQSAYAHLAKHNTRISQDLFLRSACSLTLGRLRVGRFLLGRTVRGRLRGYSRFGFFGRLSQYSRLVYSKLQHLATRRRARKFIRPEGCVIAFVGADATGKSTLISDTQAWLGDVFVTERYHVGKPRSSWLTMPVNLMLPVARLVFPRLRGNGVAKPDSASRRASLLQAFRAVAVAWDRHHLLRKVHRKAATGITVICDRYPSMCPGAMDSPRLQDRKRGAGLKGRLIDVMTRWEKEIYSRNPPPDVVVKLTVPIDVARERNAIRNKQDKHADDELTFRHQSFRLWKVTGASSTIELNTAETINQTKASLREALWNSL